MEVRVILSRCKGRKTGGLYVTVQYLLYSDVSTVKRNVNK